MYVSNLFDELPRIKKKKYSQPYNFIKFSLCKFLSVELLQN